MATVGITQDLRNRVKTKINGMRKAERYSDVPNIDKTITLDASKLYNIGCWGEKHVHLLDQIPKDWLSKVDDANVTVKGTLDDGVTMATSVRFTGMTTAYARPRNDYYNRTNSELALAFVQALPEETAGRAELLQRWDESIIALEIDKRWGKIEEEIDTFLSKCKSLNEAVKLFPGVRMYIHSDDIERLDRKLERPSQRKAIVLDVDTEGLTAAAIAAKLAAA